MSGRTRVAPGRRRRAAAAAAARLAVGHPPRPGPAAPRRHAIVDRAAGARSGNWRAQYARHYYGNSHSLCHAAPRPTHGSQQERGACAETRHPGSHGFATIQRAHQPSPHARDRVREPESILYCDCGGQADRQAGGWRTNGPSERSAASDRHMTPHARLPCCHSLIWLRRL